MDCEHEYDRYPSFIVIPKDKESPLRPNGPYPIVPCKKCGAPIHRGRYSGMMTHESWLEEKGFSAPPDAFWGHPNEV